jgi:LuxR family maltose regulon positive regulatory protein
MSASAERTTEGNAKAAISGLSPVVRTKIVPPATNRVRIERGRLLDLLQAAAGHRLILLKAPAGYGKTTLSVDWREHLQQSGAVTAWLALDDGDNEPGTFAYHLGTALHRAAPAVGQPAVDLLAEARLVNARSVVTAAINSVAESDDEIYLFLDDYHAIIDGRVHELVTFLLRHAPSNFHLVLMTRTEPALPVSRLRLSEEVAEFDSTNLRFTLDETGQFLGADLSPKLAAADISRLQEATEGWPAALQLARITLRNSTDPSSTIRSFSGASRQISAYFQDTLATQADEIVEFLLRTAVLDRLNGSLCQAVTGLPRSAELLKALDHQQLLLVTLDEREGWYRYHHLMSHYLLDRLLTRMPEQVPELHRRAYGWYAARQMWAQAVHHAIAANDLEQALAFIRQCAMDLVYKGDLLTLLAWDRQLPAELTQGQVELKLALAWGMALAMNFKEANALLAPVEEQAAADRGSELWARCVFVRAALLALLEDSAGAQRHLEDNLQPESYDYLSLNGRNVMRFAHWKAARWDDFYAVPIHDPREEAVNVTAENYRLTLYGMVAAQRLDFDEALALCADARERAVRHVGIKSIAATTTNGLSALIRYERGDVAAAEVEVLDDLAVVDTPIFHESFVRAYTVLVRAAALRQDFARAIKLVARAERLAAERGWARAAAVFVLKRIRLLLRENRIEEAQAAVARLQAIAADHPAPVRCSWSDIHVCLSVGEGLLALATGKPGIAVGQLTRAFDELQATDNRHEALRVGLDLANGHFRVGSSAKAFAILQRILGWAARANAVTFLGERPEELLQLLASARRCAAIAADTEVCRLLDRVLADSAAGREALREEPPEPAPARQALSRRERSIIEFIAGGQSNKEIARTLGVTPETIKTHVKRIFVKLSAESRAQAVVRAQSLGLLRNVEVN